MRARQSEKRTVKTQINGTARELPVDLSGVTIHASFRDMVKSDTDIVVFAAQCNADEIPGHVAAMCDAMRQGKHIVNASKVIEGSHGNMLRDVAIASGVAYLGEACVMGKIPVRRTAAYHQHLMPHSVSALLSGTCGYILSRAEEEPEKEIAHFLKEAQSPELGYAEADPTADVEAFDAAAKLKILAHDFFQAAILDSSFDDEVVRIGIMGIPPFAFQFARAMGRRVQLVGTIDKLENGRLALIVMPSLTESDSPLGSLHGVTNGIVIEDKIGPPTVYSGPGAGGLATAAAMLGDIAQICEIRRSGAITVAGSPTSPPQLVPAGEQAIRAAFISLSPENSVGVLSAKFHVLSEAGLSIEQFANEAATNNLTGDTYDIIACEATSIKRVLAAKAALEVLPCVHGKVIVLRVLGTAPLRFPLK